MTTNYAQMTDFLRFYNRLKVKYTGKPYMPNSEEFEKVKEKFKLKK